MSTQDYKAIMVVGINPEDAEESAPDDSRMPQIVKVHRAAVALFEPGMVSPLSPVGHNFVQSFAIHPSGASRGRDNFKSHCDKLDQFVTQHLAENELEWVEVRWGDVSQPEVTRSFHHDPGEVLR